MEASIPVAMSAIGTLLPLAVYASRSCYNRVRDARYIKKQVLLMPAGSGKSWLAKRLSHQRQFLVVDLDEAIRSLCEPKAVGHVDSSKAAGYDHEADLAYTELALEVLEKTQTRLKADKTLKVLFLTSSWRFASHFKRDSVCIVAPDKEAFEEHTAEKPVEERERLRKERTAFIATIPDARAIHTFKTLDEMESAIRVRLGVANVL